jgi:hypothetical protein
MRLSNDWKKYSTISQNFGKRCILLRANTWAEFSPFHAGHGLYQDRASVISTDWSRSLDNILHGLRAL